LDAGTAPRWLNQDVYRRAGVTAPDQPRAMARVGKPRLTARSTPRAAAAVGIGRAWLGRRR